MSFEDENENEDEDDLPQTALPHPPRFGFDIAMSQAPVTIHPYFKVHPGHMDACRAILPRFVERTKSEPSVLFYEFTTDGETIFCREGYPDAASTLAHIQNVGDLLQEMGTHTDMVRLELHGPAAELAKLKEPLRDLPVAWFELLDRLEK